MTPDTRYVTVGTFTVPFEAELARARLEDEGIRAFVLGDMAATAFSGFGGVGGPVQVQVQADDAPRATAILASCGPEAALDDDWQERIEGDDKIWVCTLCGEAVDRSKPECPSCGTSREATRVEVEARPTSPRPPTAAVMRRDDIASDAASPSLPSDLIEEPDLPDLATFLGDDLVRRALLAGLFGLLGIGGAFTWDWGLARLLSLCSLFTFYSCWLLGRLFLFSGELSDRGMRMLYATLVADGLSLLFWFVLFAYPYAL
jgi:hypothetical protein